MKFKSDFFADYTGCIWNAWTNFKSDLFVDYTECIWNAWTNCKSDFFSEYTGRIWNAWTKFKSAFFADYTGCIWNAWTKFKSDFFFLSFYFLLYLCLPTHCKRGGLLLLLITIIHTHSVGLLWTRDQPDAETSTWQYNTHKRQISMHLAGFDSTFPANERPQTNALDRAATGIPHKHEILHHEYGKCNVCRSIGVR